MCVPTDLGWYWCPTTVTIPATTWGWSHATATLCIAMLFTLLAVHNTETQ